MRIENGRRSGVRNFSSEGTMISKMKVSIDYGKELSPEAAAALKSIFPDHYYLKEDKVPSYFSEEIIADVEYVSSILMPFYCFRIEIVSMGNGTMAVKMKDRINQLVGEGILEEVTQYLRGGIVQVTVPDLGLISMDEVTWIEDACTEELQRRLDEGWRILAVCPPNAQR